MGGVTGRALVVLILILEQLFLVYTPLCVIVSKFDVPCLLQVLVLDLATVVMIIIVSIPSALICIVSTCDVHIIIHTRPAGWQAGIRVNVFIYDHLSCEVFSTQSSCVRSTLPLCWIHSGRLNITYEPLVCVTINKRSK